MAFSVDLPGGWFDIPDSVWASGQNAVEDQLVALNSMIRFAALGDEYFAAAPQKDGGTVTLPQSADDGYGYSRSECIYGFSVQASPDPATGKNGGPGDLLFFDNYIAQDTGVVQSGVNYFVQGGQDTATRDGLLNVLILCRRGGGNKAAVAGTPTSGVSSGTGGGPAGGGGGIATGGVGAVVGDGQGSQGDGKDGHQFQIV